MVSPPFDGEDDIARLSRRIRGYSGLIEALGVGVAAMVLLAWRAPFAIQQLWAEDGTVFLQQVINHGAFPPFGNAYAGYYLFLPRTIAALAAAAPIREAAFSMWLGTAVIVGWCAATIYAESKGRLNTFPTRALLALSIVLLPALGLEAIGSASDLQYTLLFTSLIALTGLSTDLGHTVNRVAILVVTGLTTPLALLLAPVALLRVLRARGRRRFDSTAIAWAVATAFQFGMILVLQPPGRNSKAGNNKLIVKHFNRRVLYENFLPKRFSTSTATIAPIAAIAAVLLILAAAALAWRRRRRTTAALLLLVPVIGFGFWFFAAILYGSPARYRVFPALCVVFALLVGWEELMRGLTKKRPVDWRLAGIIVLILGLSWVTYWTPDPYRTSGPTWARALATAERRCRTYKLHDVSIKTAPVDSQAKLWAVRLPCRELR
jgi:hypothetical protein